MLRDCSGENCQWNRRVARNVSQRKKKSEEEPFHSRRLSRFGYSVHQHSRIDEAGEVDILKRALLKLITVSD
jgi:hypothetical protein